MGTAPRGKAVAGTCSATVAGVTAGGAGTTAGDRRSYTRQQGRTGKPGGWHRGVAAAEDVRGVAPRSTAGNGVETARSVGEDE
jgi:hypothetical protein